MSDESKSKSFNPVEEWIPLPKAIPLGLQHVLAMFVGNITVPIIIAGIIGADAAERTFLIQAALLGSGIATFIQAYGIGPVGARLPVVQGTSFAFLPLLIPLAKNYGMDAVIGASIFGGLVQVVLGFYIGKLKRWFPPLVTGIVVASIGLTQIKVAYWYAGGGKGLHDKNFEAWATPDQVGIAMLVLLVTLVVRETTKGIISQAAVLIGMAVGYVVAIFLGMVDGNIIREASWVSLPQPFHYGLELPVVAIVGMVVMAVVTTIETVGDTNGITSGGAGRDATPKELKGAILGDAVGTLIAGVINALPNTSYTQNVGLVALTKVISRWVVVVGAFFLIAGGLVPKLGAIVAAMPACVLGGAAIFMFGMVATAGMKLMTAEKFTSRSMMIAALSISFALGLSIVPEFLAKIFNKDNGLEMIAQLLTSGIIPAAVTAVVLNAVIPQEEPADAPMAEAVEQN